MNTAFCATAAVSLLAVFAAQAAETGTCGASHPALSRGAVCATPSLDANTFIVQPPATTHWQARADGTAAHANAGHPAVAVARMLAGAGINANTFIVQPPSSVTWTVAKPPALYAGSPVAITR